MSKQVLTLQDIADIMEATIVDDLRDSNLTYTNICSRHRIGINRVVATAKKHNLIRRRGRVAGRQSYKPKTAN